MTDEQYLLQFLKKDALFIVVRMNKTVVVRRVLQDYIPDEEYIYTETTISDPGSKPYNSSVNYKALINTYKDPIVFRVKEEY